MSNHTPGPWRPYAETVVAGDPKGYSVRADCEPADKVCLKVKHDDVALIAAAPELVEALRELHDFAERSQNHKYAERSDEAFRRAADLLERIGH